MNSEMTDEDEYDLDAVEAQLARMQLQRQQRSGNRLSQPPQPQQCRPPVDHHHITASEFELNEADLSHGSESEESDCDSISTNSLSSDNDDISGTRRLTVAKKPTATRLRDSLDLSMSVAEMPKPHKAMVNDRRSKQPVHSAMCKPEPVQEQQQQHCNDAKKSRSSDAPGTILEVKIRSGGREPANDNEDDMWTSNLVRRRRQLEKEAALEKDQLLHINTTATAAAAQPHQSGIEPRFRSAKTRDTLPSSSNTTTPSSQLVQTTAAGNISNQRVADFGSCNEPTLSKKNLNTTPPAQLVKQEPRPEQVEPPLVAQITQLPSEKISIAVKKAPLVKKPSQLLSSVAPSSLKPPERYITRAPVTASASSTAQAQHPAATGLEHGAKSKGSTGTPARAPEMPVLSQTHIVSKASNKAQSNAHHHVHFSPEDDDDDDDLLSVEEEKLRQSLEKLDSRLTKLSNDTRQQHKSSKVSSQDGRTATAISGLHSSSSKTQGRPLPTTNHRHERDDDRTPPVADFADDDVVAAGAYGGGAHCKSGQVTSALERSCYTRRAEMSSGLHKLRVRTGGATAQESNNSSANLDKDGKHKVVVKRDLAHLLF